MSLSYIYIYCMSVMLCLQSFLVTQCLLPPPRLGSRLRVQVLQAWARVLLAAVFSAAGHSLAAGKGEREAGEDFPCAVLRTLLALLHPARGAVLTPAFGLLCRAVLVASVALCLRHCPPPPPAQSLSGGSSAAALASIAWAASDLQRALLGMMQAGGSTDGVAVEAVLGLALPFPDLLSFSENGTIVASTKKNLEGVTALLCRACSAEGPVVAPSVTLPVSVCDVLNILQHHCPATSIMNESTSAPNPLLAPDHAVTQLALLLLHKTSTLVR
jgi:hypothetical protein